MQQYMDIKEAHQDCILFFRLGDFYEMFFEDAKLVSRELELTLTGKNCGTGRARTHVRRAVSFCRHLYRAAHRERDTRSPSVNRQKIRPLRKVL